jgi:N-acetylglutamate synthase-like GNAT family acetyltransferase
MENEFIISEDKSKLDVEFIHRELADSYWSKQIPRSIVEKAIEHSMCFGIYDEDPSAGTGQSLQIGFARVITDKATFAYLCDVIVTSNYRGRGAGKQLMNYIMAHPDLQGLRRFTLGTLDAHELYKKYGFAAPRYPERQMEISVSGIYEKMNRKE